MAMTPGQWSISALAVEFGLDRRTVAKRLEGVPVLGMKGRAKLFRMSDAAKAVFGARADDEEDLDLQHESARLKRAQADKTELEVEVFRGNLIPGEVVEQVWSDYTTAFRAKTVALPSTAAPRVVGLTVREAEVELRELVHQALDELKDYEPGQYGHGCSESADSVGGEDGRAAAEPDGKRVGRRKSRSKPRGKRGAGPLAD